MTGSTGVFFGSLPIFLSLPFSSFLSLSSLPWSSLIRGAHVVWPDDKLGDVLRELKQGRSHMAIVRDVNREDETQDPYYEIKGIITLEDIIEEILGDEIVDETDAFVDATQTVKVNTRSVCARSALAA